MPKDKKEVFFKGVSYGRNFFVETLDNISEEVVYKYVQGQLIVLNVSKK